MYFNTRQIAVLPIAMALAGCATSRFEPSVSSFARPQADKAYVYGKFELHGESGIHVLTNNYSSIGLVFICADGSEFTIGLAPRTPDQLVEVPAQRCSLRLLTAHNAMTGRPLAERRYTGAALQNVQFKPGTLHYVGDVVGQASSEASKNINTLRWDLEEHTNRFNETTARMLTDRPAFAVLPRVDVTGLPSAGSAAKKEARQ